MKGRRVPSPEVLARTQPKEHRLITFRLDESNDAALRALAERAGVGPSTLARRVIEHYVREHAPRNKRK